MAAPEHWAVEVRVDGDKVLTIESDWLCGVPDIEKYADTIRLCAQHLMAFIGPEEIPPCFLCGGSGRERWMGPCGEGDIPCSMCSDPADGEGRVPSSTSDRA